MKKIDIPQEKTILSAIFILAVAVRLISFFLLKKHYFFFLHPSADVLYYLDWAREIARVNPIGTKTFFGLPLFPYFLAILDRLTLGNLLLVHVMQILLGSCNCALTYKLADRIFSKKVAALAGILMAIHFTLIYYDCILMPVTLITFLSLVILLTLSQKNLSPKISSWILFGLFCGLAALGDGKILIFIALTILYLLIVNRKDVKRILGRIVLPLALGVCIVIFAVGLRNRIVGGSWVWISAQSGFSFYVGNNPRSEGFFENPDFIRPTHGGQDLDQVIAAKHLARRELNAAQVSHFWRHQALAFIKKNPGSYFKLLKKKFILFFTETEKAFDLDLLFLSKWKEKWDFNAFVLLCPLGLLGMICSWRSLSKSDYLKLLIASQLAFTLIFFLTNRHRATIYPFFIIYEAFFIFWMTEKIQQRQMKKIGLAVAFFISFLFVFPAQSMNPKTLDFLKFSKTGPILAVQQKYNEAREQYFLALEIYPEDTNTLYNLANSYLLEENYDEAKYYLQITLSLNPYHVDALYNLGYALEKGGETHPALAAYQQVVAMDPLSLDAHLRMAQIYLDQNNCPKARQHFNVILQMRPQFASEIENLLLECPR